MAVAVAVAVAVAAVSARCSQIALGVVGCVDYAPTSEEFLPNLCGCTIAPANCPIVCECVLLLLLLYLYCRWSQAHTHSHRLSFALLTKTQAASLGFCLIFPHLMSFFLFLDFWFVVFRFVSGRYVNFALLQRHTECAQVAAVKGRRRRRLCRA